MAIIKPVILEGGQLKTAGVGDQVPQAFVQGLDTSLETKVDKVAGKGLSDTNFTKGEKDKLSGVADEATKNRDDSENADKVHNHTVEQVSGLGYAATAGTVGAGAEVMRAGAYGLGRLNDLREEGWVVGPPSGYYGKGYVSGFVDGASMGISGYLGSHGVLEVFGHWVNTTGAQGSATRMFRGGGNSKIYFSFGVDADTWGPWIEVYSSDNLLNIGTTPDTARAALGLGYAATAPTVGTGSEVMRAGAFGYGAFDLGYDTRPSRGQSRKWGNFSDPSSTTGIYGYYDVSMDSRGYGYSLEIGYQGWADNYIVKFEPSGDTETFVAHKLFTDKNLLNIGTTAATARSALELGYAATAPTVGGAGPEVMLTGAYGLGGRRLHLTDQELDSATVGQFFSTGPTTVAAYSAGIALSYQLDGYTTQIFTQQGTLTPYISIRNMSANEWGQLVYLHHTGNILQTTGSSTDFPMSQKATTDAIANIPSVPKSEPYAVTAADKGKSIDTGYYVYIPASLFAVGDVIVVTNTSDYNINIEGAPEVTVRLAGTASTGIRTLAGYGVATFRMVSNNVWYGSGAGLS